MINKENLDTIINDVTWSYEECGGEVPQNILDTLNEIKQVQCILNEYNVTAENIREILLTGQMFRNQSTLSECIKEWEDRGFIVNNNELYIFLHHEQYGISMFINKKEIKYHVYHGYISLELNELLNKTLKALEVEDDK
jgi:hypothetical protein